MLVSSLSLTAPPLPPLIYNDQSSSATLDFGSAGINLVATNYTGRVTWWFNGAPVPTDGSSQKYSITPDMLTLTIRNIVFNDSGLYQAELTDAEPTQFLNYQIDVRKSKLHVPPTHLCTCTHTQAYGLMSVIIVIVMIGVMVIMQEGPLNSYL